MKKVAIFIAIFICLLSISTGCTGQLPEAEPAPSPLAPAPEPESSPSPPPSTPTAPPPAATPIPQPSPSPTPAPTPPSPPSTPTPPPPTIPGDERLEGPALSADLKRGYEAVSTGDDFDDTGLEIGELAVGLTLKNTGGAEFELSRLLAEKPVVMVFGSFT